MNYFDGLYTLTEIAINNNIPQNDMSTLIRLMKNKEKEKIQEKFPKLAIFLPYCDWYIVQGENMLCMPALYYDTYQDTGLLPNLENFDINPDVNKLEHWQYTNPIMFEINPDKGFEFAKNIYPKCNIWNLLLSGCARMDYYEGESIPLEQRIKYAIVEYMIRRPQFFTTEDFVENEILHKKYRRKEDK